MFILVLLGGIPSLAAQANLTLSTEPIETQGSGTYEFLIPANLDTLIYPQIRITLYGADGGRVRYEGNFSNTKIKGGGGAEIAATFDLGLQYPKLHPGGTLRFIVGERGQNGIAGANGDASGGGGGGTAVLYLAPGETDNWTILLVAGGGSGASADSNGQFGGFSSSEGFKAKTNTAAGGGGPNGENAGGTDGADGADSNVSNGGSGYLTAGSTLQPADNTYDNKGGAGYGAGGSSRDDRSGSGGGGGYSGGGAGENGIAGGGGGSAIIPTAVDVSTRQGNNTRFPEDGLFRYQFIQDFTPGTPPTARCITTPEVFISGGQSTTYTPADLDNGSFDPAGLDLTYQMCQTPDNITYFCRDSKTWECNDIGRNQPWYLAVNNGYQTSYCLITLRIQEEETAPVCPANITVDPTNGCSVTLTPEQLAAVETGSCGQVSTVALRTPGSFLTTLVDATDFFDGYTFLEGSTNVRYSTEGGSCSYQVNVGAGTLLLLDCPDNVNITLPANECEATVNAADLALNYAGPGSIRYFVVPETTSPDVTGNGQMPTFTFERGTNSIDYVVNEPGGCEGLCNFLVNVDRTTNGPVDLACQDVSVIFNENLGFRNLLNSGIVRAEDNCGPAPVELLTGFLNTCPAIGNTYPVQVRVGNGSFAETCTFDLSFTAPDVTPNCFVNRLFVTLNDILPVTIQPTQIGNWTNSPGIVASLDFSEADCDDVQTVPTVTLTLTDECGNTGSCSRVVAIRDGIAPSITCQDVTLNLDETGTAYLSHEDVIVSASDNCGVDNIAYSLEQTIFTCDDRGTTEIFLTATDNGGLEGRCRTNITVGDVIPPTINCKDFTVQLSDEGSYRFGVADLVESASDNCNVGYIFSKRDLSCDDLTNSPITVTMTGRDGSNIRSSCTSQVTILPPECPCLGTTNALVVNDPEDAVLCSDLTVSSLRFLQGNLDLQGYELTIQNSGGRIFDESNSERIFDFANGSVVVENVSNNFINLLAELGLRVFSGDEFNFNEVRRSPQSTVIDGTATIARVLTLDHNFSESAFTGARFNYLDTELNGISENELGLFVEENGVWRPLPFTNLNTVDNYVEFDYDFNAVNGPVRFTLAPASVLPLDLLSFNGRTIDKINHLRWTTVREEGFSHFVIERSPTGSEWTEIGTTAGAGREAAQPTNYNFTDETPLEKAYYRLKMVDLDGSFSYSSVVLLELATSTNDTFTVFPNPSTGRFSVQLANHEDMTLSLYDLSGRRIWTRKAMDMSYTAPRGVYLIVASYKDGSKWTQRIVIQ